ncbi:MAG: RnfABCDGE type electron transport complex subunit G [Lachnospiraceae bacterium]|nr:RnfABCDGE type electron transport complex subunit G [Lachnospiraceae bacterium]
MKKRSDLQNLLHDAGILVAITLVAGILLGLVYGVTKDPIKKQEELALQNACKEVFAGATSFEDYDYDLEKANTIIHDNGYAKVELSDTVRKALDANGNPIGYILTVTSSEGYGGDIQFTMGIKNDGTLNGISILSISETAGLGMRAEEVLKPQFFNKNVEKFEYTKSGAVMENQIDAISGATITTNAVTNAVNGGLSFFAQELKGVE